MEELIDLRRDHGIAFPDELEEICFLTPFAVEFRYGLFEENEEPFDRERVFRLLLELRKWVNTIIPS